MADLSVELSAEIVALDKALDKAKASFKDYEKAAEKASEAGDELPKGLETSLKKLRLEIKRLEKELAGVSKGKAKDPFKPVKKSALNATPSLLEFNRTIQDAPFGILGVSNNIQQLTGNFGALSQRAGGTTAALKAMLAGLAGPQGVLLAVSAITSLLLVFRDRLKFATSQVAELTEATKGFVASAKLEINSINTLIGIASNAANSYLVRSGALKELNDKYPEYLENLKLEETNSDFANTAVAKLNRSILQGAKVRGVQKAIEEILAKNSEDLTESLLKQRAAQNLVREELIRLNDKYKLGVDLTQGFSTATSKTFDVLNKTLGGTRAGIGNTLALVVNQFNQATTEVAKITKEIETEIDPLNDILARVKIGELQLRPEELAGVTVIGEKLKTEVDKVKNDFVNLDDIFGIERAVQRSLDRLQPLFENFKVQANKFGDIIGFELKRSNRIVKAETPNLTTSLTELTGELNAIIGGSFAVALGGIASGIEASFTQGGTVIQQASIGLLGAIGGILIELGGAAISFGIGLKAIKISLETLNPVVAIAAGVALITLGAVFKGAASKAGGRIGGGGGTSGGGTSGGGAGGGGITTTTTTTAPSFDPGEVVFKIEGNALVGVLDRASSKNQRLGRVNG